VVALPKSGSRRHALAYLTAACAASLTGRQPPKLLTGTVTMDVQDALSAADRANGLIVACQARPVGDVSVDV